MRSSKLTYMGKVTIIIDGKSKTQVFNEGTPVLFDSLYAILTTIYHDDQTIRKVLPTYMSIVPEKKYESDKLDTCYTNYVNEALVTKTLNIKSRENNVTSCTFTSSFPHSLANTSVEPVGNCYVLLIDASYRIMAFASIASESIAAVFNSAATTAVIEWEMKFDNIQKETTND